MLGDRRRTFTSLWQLPFANAAVTSNGSAGHQIGGDPALNKKRRRYSAITSRAPGRDIITPLLPLIIRHRVRNTGKGPKQAKVKKPIDDSGKNNLRGTIPMMPATGGVTKVNSSL